MKRKTIKEFRSVKEIQKYLNPKTDLFEFIEDGKYIDLVIFNCKLNICGSIKAKAIKAYFNIDALQILCDEIYAEDIRAVSITSKFIKAHDINVVNLHCGTIYANNILAENIKYNDSCISYCNTQCNSIERGISFDNKSHNISLYGKSIIKGVEMEND